MNATVERFLQYLRHERNLSQRTVDTYRRNLEQWQDQVTATGRALDLASVTANDIREWLIDRAARGDAPATLRPEPITDPTPEEVGTLGEIIADLKDVD